MSAYLTISEAQAFMDARLMTDAWDLANDTDRNKALAQATQIIDRLNFKGDKADSDQELEFPRGTDTSVPAAIQQACAEIALSLLDGNDPAMEANNVAMVSQGLGNVRSTYNPAAVPIHTLHGVPSIIAWYKLRPYIRHVGTVKISRGS